MGRKAKMSPEQERLNLVVESSMRAEIRDFRFQERFDSEGDAVRELLRIALEQAGIRRQQAA